MTQATLTSFYNSRAFDPEFPPSVPSDWLPTGFDESVYDQIDGMFECGELEGENIELLAHKMQDKLNTEKREAFFNRSIHDAVKAGEDNWIIYQKKFKSGRVDKDITFDHWEFLRSKTVQRYDKGTVADRYAHWG
jgi:hypothetical protein